MPITHGSYYEVRPPALDGTGEISMRDLVKFVLAMRPDRIVVGEVRGAEAFELSRAVNAGCGFLCTVHANSAAEALDALVNAALMAGENVTERIVRKVFSESLDVVVHLDRDDMRRGDADTHPPPGHGDRRGRARAARRLHRRAAVRPRRLGAPLRWTGALPSRLEQRLARVPAHAELHDARRRRGASAMTLARRARRRCVLLLRRRRRSLGHPPRLGVVATSASGGRARQQLWLDAGGRRASRPLQFWAGRSLRRVGRRSSAPWFVTGTPLVALVPAVAVASLPRAFFARRRATRLREVQAAWPDGLRDLVASIAAGRSLDAGARRAREHRARRRCGPRSLAFPDLRADARHRALRSKWSRRSSPTRPATACIEVLILAHERGGQIVKEILDDLVVATTKDLKVLDEIETEGLEMKINARAVLVLPWFVLVALTLRGGRVPRLLPVAGGACGRARRRRR